MSCEAPAVRLLQPGVIAGLTHTEAVVPTDTHTSHQFAQLTCIFEQVGGSWRAQTGAQGEAGGSRGKAPPPALGMQTWDLLSIRQRPSSMRSSPPSHSAREHQQTKARFFSLSVGLEITGCDLHLRRSTARKLERGHT